MTSRRGEVWLVDFGEPLGREQAGRRPALIVSDDDLNDGPSGLVIVVPITSARRGLPSHIEIDDAGSGLDAISYAKCEDVKSVSDRRMISRLGVAPLPAVFAVERALRFLLGL
jgi:mRNA interferase MazF